MMIYIKRYLYYKNIIVNGTKCKHEKSKNW